MRVAFDVLEAMKPVYTETTLLHDHPIVSSQSLPVQVFDKNSRVMPPIPLHSPLSLSIDHCFTT